MPRLDGSSPLARGGPPGAPALPSGGRGSSPPARGGRPPAQDQFADVGLIPARAGRTRSSPPWPATSAAHPRSRGADALIAALARHVCGSSPLARGGLRDLSCSAPVDRLIPARAGRTPFRSTRTGMPRAHPHSRGADWRPWSRPTCRQGSSPLARGGRLPSTSAFSRWGLIPARAGRTPRSPEPGRRLQAHPRSPGADRRSYGSDVGYGGLIPARAGRTRPKTTGGCWTGAHPRSRGADDARTMLLSGFTGSSPLARGGRATRQQGQRRPRLIPARAGRTPTPRTRTTSSTAHPRSRGADVIVPGAYDGVLGSSPLARGGPLHTAHHRDGYRLIPARAGRTPAGSTGSSPCRAHPRSRGADSSHASPARVRPGSSPLARGGRLASRPPHRAERLIPARAGRTSPM
mgnify:CR=1 FL=1